MDLSRVEACFRRVVLAPDDSRERALDEASEGDGELRSLLSRMVDAHHRPISVHVPATPTRIGPYRILGKIGSGATGVVYEAEQDSPRKHVALKVIDPAVASPSIYRRLEFEGELLARLAHSGIAQVYQLGVYEGPRGPQPYLAMELVSGTTLLDFAASKNLGTNERLGLVEQLCDAVHHAHTRGVVHRDLKPANILVDALGNPKVLDFGVARTLDADARISLESIDTGQVIGTLAYMSPEQAEGRSRIADARSDVYSIGVIAYELLAGRLPIDVAGFPLPAALRRVIEVEPTRAGTIDRSLRGDLDIILAKALEKDPDRRYASATDLGAEIARFRANQPILARAPSLAYEVFKFSKRHRGLSAGLVATTVAVSSGLGASLASLARATRAEAESSMRAMELERAAAFQDQILGGIDIVAAGANLKRDLPARFETALAVSGLSPEERAERARRFNDDLALLAGTDAAVALVESSILSPATREAERRFAASPLLHARAKQTIADAYESLGQFKAAEPLQREALAIRVRELGPSHPDTIISRINMGHLLLEMGEHAEAEAMLRATLLDARRALGNGHHDTLSTLNNLGVVLQLQGRLDEAEPLFRECLDARRKALGDKDPDTVNSISNLASVLKARGRLDDAQALHDEAYALRKEILGDDHRDTILSLSKMASTRFERGERGPGVARHLREAVDKSRSALGEDHPETLSAINNYAMYMQSQRRLTDAASLFEQAVKGLRKVHGDDHPITLMAINNFAVVRRDQGRLDDAEALYRAALAGQRKALGNDHEDVVITLNNLGDALRLQGRLDESEPLFAEALKTARATLGPDHPSIATCLNNLGTLLLAKEKSADAEPLLRESLAMRLRLGLAPDHPGVSSTKSNLAKALLDQRKFAEALPMLEEVLPHYQNNLGPDGVRTAEIRMGLGVALAGLGRFADAEPHALEAHRVFSTIANAPAGALRRSIEDLAELYAAWATAAPEKAGDAAAWRKRLDEYPREEP